MPTALERALARFRPDGRPPGRHRRPLQPGYARLALLTPRQAASA